MEDKTERKSPSQEWKDKGNEFFALGDYVQAVYCYTAAIDLEPENAVFFSNRSAAYLLMEDFDKAKRDASMCVQLEPTWAKGYWRQGSAELKKLNYKAALRTFEKGLESNPKDSDLMDGKRKAMAGIETLRRIKGSRLDTDEFDIDGPSQRQQNQNSDQKNKDSQNIDDKVEETENDGVRTGDARIIIDDGLDESIEKMTWPRDSEVEIRRIRNARNYYRLLYVTREASNSEIKKHYYALARLLHPDKCSSFGAVDAMTQVSTAYSTLTNPIKRVLYDQYLRDISHETNDNDEDYDSYDEKVSGCDDGDDDGDIHSHPLTYAEWEAKQHSMNLPRWLASLLQIRGCGYVIAVLLFILTLPIIIVVLALMIVLWILCLPYYCILSCCFPETFDQMKEEAERSRSKIEEELQDQKFQHI